MPRDTALSGDELRLFCFGFSESNVAADTATCDQGELWSVLNAKPGIARSNQEPSEGVCCGLHVACVVLCVSVQYLNYVTIRCTNASLGQVCGLNWLSVGGSSGLGGLELTE